MECRAWKLGAARDTGNWPNPTQTHSFHGSNNHCVCVCMCTQECAWGRQRRLGRGARPPVMEYIGGRKKMVEELN